MTAAFLVSFLTFGMYSEPQWFENTGAGAYRRDQHKRVFFREGRSLGRKNPGCGAYRLQF